MYKTNTLKLRKSLDNLQVSPQKAVRRGCSQWEWANEDVKTGRTETETNILREQWLPSTMWEIPQVEAMLLVKLMECSMAKTTLLPEVCLPLPQMLCFIFKFPLNKHTIESSLEGVGRLWRGHLQGCVSVLWGQETICRSAERGRGGKTFNQLTHVYLDLYILKYRTKSAFHSLPEKATAASMSWVLTCLELFHGAKKMVWWKTQPWHGWVQEVYPDKAPPGFI